MFLMLIMSVLILYVFLGYKTPRLAIITMPIAVSFFFIVFASHDLGLEAVTSLLIFFTTLLAIIVRPHETDIVPWPKRAAKLAFTIVLTMGITIGLFILSFPIGTVFIGLLGIICGYLIGANWTGKNYTTAYVISTIGASMRQNLPLPMALQSAAENLKYKHSIILRQISKWLLQGYSLSESIKRGFRNCPARITALIAAGEKTNQLPRVIETIEKDLLENAEDRKSVRPVYPATYFIAVLICMTFIVVGLMVFIIPKFSSVIKDMTGGSLPKSTMLLIKISNYVCFNFGWAIMLGILFITAVIYSTVRFRPRRTERPRLLSRIGDFIKWHLPMVHWFENNYSNLQTVEVLKISLNSGSTLNQAIRNTIELDVNCRYRGKLKKWLRLVEAGENPAKSLKQAGLSASLAIAFDQNSENTLNVLEMLENVYRTNYSFRVNLARFILLPCVTILLGGVVGFVNYSVVAVMVEIITACSNFV
ncbi:MAG: type II secretion system F family protein [Planctomycetaceae bacterium]|nr:type II secretion system F family protein [Planctomycetaceae bacterium]